MDWSDIFSNLKSIINIDLSSLKHFIKTGKIKILSDNTIQNTYHYDHSKTLIVNIDKLDSKGLTGLGNLLKEAKDNGYTLLESNSKKIIEDLRNEESKTENRDIIEFFKDKVSPEDLEIIRGALYVRERFRRRDRNIAELKEDLRSRYGLKANNVVNLCTSGYFENYFIPYYEHLKEYRGNEEEEAKRDFKKFYNAVVRYLPFSVFVCIRKSGEEAKREIVEKLERNLKYGTKFLNIHGIGKQNVATITDAVAELEKVYGDRLVKEVDAKGQIISVRLEIRD